MTSFQPISDEQFYALYPDVDPTRSIPLSFAERLYVAASAAVMAFGAVSARFAVFAVGFALMMCVTVGLSRTTARRIRLEARHRFPQQPWAENHTPRSLKILAIGFTLAIAALIAAAFWFIPPAHITFGALVIALIVALCVLFFPGTTSRRA